MYTRTVSRSLLLHLLVVVSLSLMGSLAAAQNSSTISYQGTLHFEGSPVADGQYPMTVTLYGNQQGTDAIWTDTYKADIRGGVFNVLLGSGKPLPDPITLDRSLWVGIRIGESEEMRPRTPLGAVPLSVNVSDRSITMRKLAPEVINALLSSKVNQSPQEADDWDLTGNGGTTAGTNFLGTTDSVALELKVYSSDGTANRGSKRVMRFEPNATSANLVGGFQGSSVAAGVVGGTISGGGSNGSVNNVWDDFGTVAGGANNSAGSNNTNADDAYATVGGGQTNLASGAHSTVGGGLANTATGDFSTTSGGQFNQSTSTWSAIGGGDSNMASNSFTVIGGGRLNLASGGESTIAGGNNNASRDFRSSIGGGYYNIINVSTGSAGAQTIGGGDSNTIGTLPPTQLINTIFSTIGGGHLNQIYAHRSTIGGGDSNVIGTWPAAEEAIISDYGTIAGGHLNQIYSDAGTIGGGDSNTIGLVLMPPMAGLHSDFSTISGGYKNRTAQSIPILLFGDTVTISGGAYNSAFGSVSTIGGGTSHIVTGDYSTISGGYHNQVLGADGTIAGGRTNIVSATGGAIGGGTNNNNSGFSAVIAGGDTNSASGLYAVIGGGTHNNNLATSATISGGASNTTTGSNSAIGGGYGNSINTGGTSAVIAGGFSNSVTSTGGAIVGGTSNQNSGNDATIGGGYQNNASGTRAAIGGGTANYNAGENSTIGGGIHNYINSDSATIGGGLGDSILLSDNATIGGGRINVINMHEFSTIGGGDSNRIQSPDEEDLRTHSVISGGRMNWIEGTESAIAGGHHLKLGDNSFGFNGSNSNSSLSLAYTDLRQESDIAYFGGVDVWIGNIDDQTHELRFYAKNSDTNYVDDANDNNDDDQARYTGFKAPDVLDDSPLIYILPPKAPGSGDTQAGQSFLTSTSAGELHWQDQVDLSTQIKGILPVSNGGTGISSVTTNSVLYGNGTAAMGIVNTTGVQSGWVLTYNGTTTAPSWSAPTITTLNFNNVVVTGTLTATNGGTGLSSVANNGILYGTGGNTLGVVSTASASAGYVLTYNGSSAPTWSPASVSSVDFDNMTLYNELEVNHGGTGLSSVANNGILYGTGGNTLGVVSTASAQNGYVLTYVDDGQSPLDPPVWSPVGINSIDFGEVTTEGAEIGDILVSTVADEMSFLSLPTFTDNGTKVLAVSDGNTPTWVEPAHIRGGMNVNRRSVTLPTSGAEPYNIFASLSADQLRNYSYYGVTNPQNGTRRVVLDNGGVGVDGQVILIQNRGTKKIRFDKSTTLVINKGSNRSLSENDCIMLMWEQLTQTSGQWVELSITK